MSAYRAPELAHAARERELGAEIADLGARVTALQRRNADEVAALLRKRRPWGRLATWLLGLALGFAVAFPLYLERAPLALIRERLFDTSGARIPFGVAGDLDGVTALVVRALDERFPGFDWLVSPERELIGIRGRWWSYRQITAVTAPGPAGEPETCMPVLWLEAGPGDVVVHVAHVAPEAPDTCPSPRRNFTRYPTPHWGLWD